MRPHRSVAKQVRHAFSAALDVELDSAMREAGSRGLDALIYDYTPVPFTHDGRIAQPSFVGMRNVPSDMEAMWRDGGFYLSDPVQMLAFRSVLPLYWSYHFDEPSALDPMAQGAVANYLRERQIARGFTMPVRTPTGGCATVTGFWRQRPGDYARDGRFAGDFMVFAHKLHDRIITRLGQDAVTTIEIRLTPRELECIRLCAEGLSDKQVAFALERSISTVVMHLQSAMKMLEARNRAQAIARAAHYGLLR